MWSRIRWAYPEPVLLEGRRFADLNELNEWLESPWRNHAATARHPERKDTTLDEIFVEGKNHLLTLPISPASTTSPNLKMARFFNVLDLVNQLEEEKLDGRGGKLAEQLARHHVVVLDELGYLPSSKNGGLLLFHLTYTADPAFLLADSHSAGFSSLETGKA